MRSNVPGRFAATCKVALFAGLLVCSDCGGPAAFLGARDREIKEATQSIETAHADGKRAQAYSLRGTAYSEKARYSRLMKLTTREDYERLFALAIADHDRAVALNPASAQVYFNRAQAYYDRGSGDLIYDEHPYAGKPRDNRWLEAAAADFERSAERNPRSSLTFDRLGLTYESNGEPEQAIRAYTREMELDRRLGKMRLADAYCVIGYERQLQNDLHAAVEAYRKSTEFGTADDKTCPVEPGAATVAIQKELTAPTPAAR